MNTSKHVPLRQILPRVGLPALLVLVGISAFALPSREEIQLEGAAMQPLARRPIPAPASLESDSSFSAPLERVRGPLQIEVFDRLTQTPLRLDQLGIEAAGMRETLEPHRGQIAVNGDWIAEDSNWVYALPTVDGDISYRVDMRSAAPDNGKVYLPYRAGVHGTVVESQTGRPIQGARILAYLFKPEALADLRSSFGGPGSMPQNALDSLATRVELYRSRYGSIEVEETLSDEQGRFKLVVPRSGQVTIHAWHPNHIARTMDFDLEPGYWTEWSPHLNERPVVHGILRDHEGNPVANADVMIGALREVGGPDISPLESALGSSMIQASRSAGDLPVQAVWRGVKTNSKGEYSMEVPAAQKYAAFSVHGGSYVFDEIESAGLHDSATQIDLQLGESQDLPPIPVSFEDGTPAANAEVGIAIKSDFPWFRQFPLMKTDENGLLHLPWRQAEVDYGLFIYPEDSPAHVHVLTPDATTVEIPKGQAR